MDSLANATQMSILTRFLANIFIFCVLMTTLLAAGFQLINHQAIDPLLTSVLATGIGYSLHMLGLNQGVTLEPVTPSATKKESAASAKETGAPPVSGS